MKFSDAATFGIAIAALIIFEIWLYFYKKKHR